MNVLAEFLHRALVGTHGLATDGDPGAGGSVLGHALRIPELFLVWKPIPARLAPVGVSRRSTLADGLGSADLRIRGPIHDRRSGYRRGHS